jgi:hypothetical protein
VILASVRDTRLLQNVCAGSLLHPVSCLVGTGGSFPGLKCPRCESDNSPESSVEVKNPWSCQSTPMHAFVACMWITLPLLRLTNVK